MPKQAASGKTKVNAFIREFHNELISTPTDELFCKLCEKVVKHDKRFHVDQHRNGSVHQAKLTIPTTSRQSFISTPNIPNFNETVVKTFLGANIPLKKLRHPAIRRLFIDMGHLLPSESTSRRIVENIAKEEENQMIYNFTNKDIFIVIDVITRLGTWLDAAVNCFAEKLPQIREIIAQFPEDGQIVTKVKHAALSPELELELTEICRCYKSLLNLIGRIEGTSYSIMQAYRDLHALQFQEDPCSISDYISNRLLGNDFLDIINCTRENITPAMFSQLQQCCATSCEV